MGDGFHAEVESGPGLFGLDPQLDVAAVVLSHGSEGDEAMWVREGGEQ